MEITAEGMLGNHDTVKCTNPADSGALVSTEGRPSRVIEATLENESVWSRFHSLGTEMLLTPQGRRMFPCCRFRLRGLDPDLQYFLLMDIAPLDDLRHRFNGEAWEPDGPGEAHLQSPVCFHPDSPAVGQHWMDSPVSFYTVKLTHDSCEREGVLLQPMHRYQPRLYVAPVSACLERAVPLKSPNVHMFTFPKTEFYAVTSYQNPQITRLKIDCNPFMLAFREDETSARLIQNKLKLALTPARTHTAKYTADNHTTSDGEQHLSSTHTSPDECVSGAAVRDSQMARSCQRSPRKAGRRPLSRGQRVVLRRPRPMKRGKKARAKWWTRVKNVQALLDHRKRMQSISTHTDVCMQPDLEDVEGVLFVSFTAKEALDVHVGNMRSSVGSSSPPPPSPSISPSSHTQQLSACVTDPPVTEADRISELELALLQDLKEKKNRQILHPALQKVGVKLNLLDHTAPVDLHYLGVDLPAAVTHTPQEHTPSSSESGFVSRTGKTNDLTRIKGWMEKFSLRSTSGTANSSAFCSEMLDEYLESEGQRISERAEVFSSSDPSPVVYQLPVRSSSYVRTLDSVLQMRTSPSAAATAPQQPSRRVAKRMRISPVRVVSRPVALPQPAVYSAGVGRVRSRRGRKRRRPHISFNRDAVDGAQPSCTEKHTQLRTLEEQALTHGQIHTFISTERARVSLSALLTAQSVLVETPQWSTHIADDGACAKLFCRLGCVCDSLSRESAGSTHCRRVECMFSCTCFKHKILLIRSADHSQSVRSLQTLHPDPEGRPAPAARVTRLWERSAEESDPEPMSTPKPAGALRPAPRTHTHTHTYTLTPRGRPPANRPPNAQVPMEKDPVYLYLESMMTCARVREYNSNPPPQVHILPAKKSSDEALSDTSLLNPSKRPHAAQSPDKPEPTKVLEIISGCNWESQRSRVLKELFQRVQTNTLPSVLSLDDYTVKLLSEHLKKDGPRSMITYKVCVSLSDKEKSAQKECVQKECVEKERVQKERGKEPALKPVPLLCGVMTAGHLKAQRRAPDLHCPIQVNGRTYAQAKLTLGRMGSLHPANRLAAYVTGRIKSFVPSRTRTTAASRRSKYTATRANHSTDVFKKPATQRLSIPRPPGGIRFPKVRRILNALAPPLSAADRVVPASALPPGQQVVLQPVAGMSGVNMCQFNGQMIQLVPVSAAAPMQIQTSTTHSSGGASQEPQSSLQLPANTALPFIIPRIHSVPGRNGFTFASAAAPGVQNNLLNKTGTFSFRICPPSAESQSPAPTGAPQGSVTASTLILPGGYKLIKLINPAEKPDQNNPAERVENSQSSVCVKVEPAEAEEDITTQSAHKPPALIKTEPEHIQIPQLTNDGGTAKFTIKIEDAEADESVPQQQSRRKEEPFQFGGFSFEGLTNSAFSRLSFAVPSPPAEPGEPDGSVQKSLDWLWRGRADVDTHAELSEKPQQNGTLMYSSDGCTTEDSMEQLSEGEVDIETFEENDQIISRLREKARRKIQSRVPPPPPRSRQLKVKPVKSCTAHPVRLMSDLLLYRRTRRLNQPIREKRRQLELLQSERTLRRTMCVREQSISTEELLHQACELITSLEDHSRFLIEEKRALMRQHSHYQTLICISQASVAAEQKTGEHPEDTPQTHTPSAVNRTSRLPSVILRSFRTAHLLTPTD